MAELVSKKCQRCKKNVEISSFINERGKIVGKCSSCRLTLTTKNIKREKCEKCGIRPSFNFAEETKGRFCVTHKEAGMIDVITKRRCEYNGCTSRPSFNFEGETKSRFCKTHKEANMINVVERRRCERDGCSIIPTFNFESEMKGRFCSTHKELGMIDVVNKRCEYNGCMIKPCFNFEGEVKGRFCEKHKKVDMINIVNKRHCEQSGCKSKPSFNFEGESKSRFCSVHKEVGMINIVENRHCERDGCQSNPSFNFEGETKRRFCSKHKEDGMIDVVSKKCEGSEGKCMRQPSFNFAGETTGRFCSIHKEVNMVDVKNKRCKECAKRSNYNMPGMFPEYCLDHKKDGMIYNPRKRCETNGCNEPATHGIDKPISCEEHSHKDFYNLCERRCTNPNCSHPSRFDILNNEGLCVTFCSMIKQDEMMKKYMKKKEEFIGKMLEEHISEKLSHKNQVIDNMCAKVRPDYVYDCGTHIVIIEVDEYQHRGYKNCGTTREEKVRAENRRMFSIFQSFGGPHTVFIRYNPDIFRVSGNIVTVHDKKRHECLLRWVRYYIKNGVENPLEVKYLFYDEYNESDLTKIILTEDSVV